MKARSNGLPMPHQQDDWGDGSWTVDCVCGVNFDDGEEMVDCDDCGVWVHTRCVRYVKSEKVFACDKCKSKNSRNDSEETEVAQLLVELPTKTLNMDNPINSSLPSQRAFRLWTELPMDEKVHVQGVPGGDSALFAVGVSSIFNPHLWKCTGYVPKKLNFRYREFSCWDTESDVGDDKRGVENNGTNADNNGADVLFSLSKESNFLPPMTNSTMVKSNANKGNCNESLSSKHTKRSDGLKLNTNMKKSSNSPHPIVIHSEKRKQDGFKIEKDQMQKKKKRGQISDKGDFKKKSPSIKKACKLLNGENERQFDEDRGSKVINADSNRTKTGSREGAVLTNHLVEDSQRLDNGYSDCRITSNSSENHSKAYPANMLKENSSLETLPPEQNGNQGDSKIHSSQWEKDKYGMEAIPIKEEGDAFHGEALNISAKLELQKSESVSKVNVRGNLEGRGPQIRHNLNGESLTCSSVPETEVKADDGCEDFDIHSSSACDPILERTRSLPHHADTSNVLLCEIANVKKDVPVVNSEDRCPKTHKVDSNSSIVGCKNVNNADGLSHDLCNSSQETALSEDAERAQNSALGLRRCSTQHAGDTATKTSSTTLIGTAPCQRKVRVTIGKSAATSSKLALKPSPVESCIYSTGVKRGMSDNNLSSKGEAISSNVVMDEKGHEKSKKMVGELQKSSVSSASKAQMTKTTYVSSSKRETLSDSRESMPQSSPRSISARNLPANSGSGDSSSSLQSEGASSLQNKPMGTHLLQKGEKVNPPESLSSLKENATPMHPPTLPSPAALSDEELALLLHQQLNSSSRVPRVPRMRHAGSLPTLTSPAATSILVKRASFGGKDHGLSSRKRKDLTKDVSMSAQEGAAESYKKQNGLNSTDYKREDTHVKREADKCSIKSVISLKKTSPSSSTAGGSNCVPSSHEVKQLKLSSSQNSQRNTVGDDNRVSEHPARTLPGLIAEIMSKGERMTYEELCNAVLPHWPHLRKHNGERYAYSSHSQAVLDCLRNRSEWARLVDRGPKGGPRLTAGRKRRKTEDSQSNELDYENGDGSCGGGRDKDEGNSKSSDQEELPKGRRKSTKRRHLTQGGRRKKDSVRRRHHRSGVISDDDEETASFSSCSDDDTMFCEDDDDDDDADYDMEGDTASPNTKGTSPSSAY